MGYCKPFWSYKFKKSGLRYEVGLCILTGDICWWSGPYAPGVWNDLAIFGDSLAMMLEPGEWCETDRGYQGSAPTHIKCPGVCWADPNTVEIQHRVRSRQETVNERIKIGRFWRPRTVMIFWSTKHFWCYCSSHPAFFCGQPFVSSSLLLLFDSKAKNMNNNRLR